MNWTQPICTACYNKRYPNREPVKLREKAPEVCCDCGQKVADGIYFRVDPRTVKFPAEG